MRMPPCLQATGEAFSPKNRTFSTSTLEISIFIFLFLWSFFPSWFRIHTTTINTDLDPDPERYVLVSFKKLTFVCVGGVYLKVDQLAGLLQYLIWVFLPAPPLRKMLGAPPPVK
jgi:hypothetical protein